MTTPERYYVERTLGSGAMATVYLARDRALNRTVAMKVLADEFAHDSVYRDRFLREARLAAGLVHPNVVQVYDVGEDERGPFIVMEYVEGETLASELQRRGVLPPAEVVAIGIQLCSALEAAHAVWLVHRDIKPHNILRGADRRVKLADFGLASSVANADAATAAEPGTSTYLSPEQANGGPVTAATDIYSLGVVLFQLLTGQMPLRTETGPSEATAGHVDPPRTSVPNAPAALGETIVRCLASQPEARPASAAILARELAASLDEPVTEPLPEATGILAVDVLPAAPPAEPPLDTRFGASGGRQRRRLFVVATAVALLTLALISAIAFTDLGSNNPATPQVRSATPVEEISNVRVAISGSLATGELDASVARDLTDRLDAIQTFVVGDKIEQAARKTADMLGHLDDLARQAGRITVAATARIREPLKQLATLLAKTPGG